MKYSYKVLFEYDVELMNYCYNCGAEMEGGADGHN